MLTKMHTKYGVVGLGFAWSVLIFFYIDGVATYHLTPICGSSIETGGEIRNSWLVFRSESATTLDAREGPKGEWDWTEATECV